MNNEEKLIELEKTIDLLLHADKNGNIEIVEQTLNKIKTILDSTLNLAK